ncbi:MFS transporter [Nocardia otitidiscaviarum]|uniref:MFS transporter n=1 Tax=Nocardia otitidiscaviarum TaxID=1823 RepID=A0A516NJT9_9NOCA|nr:MFS transporter [Nocardia otitidiscaviarum]MCP9620593.1 MFS transporter [Nocardia otitidiscaviarum]QDP79149.1 MFS transporter [Nocardia otitidiscaviarum]
MSTTPTAVPPSPPVAEPAPTLVTGLWRRKLPHYPDTGPRYWYLAVVVVTSVVLYYQLFVAGAVGNELIAYFGLTFRYFIGIFIIGAAFGAVASVVAGVIDRWGRANIVAWGAIICTLLTLFAVPATTTRESFLVVYTLISIVEGAVLVATPALVRDFSPQLDRASAMGFWTLGPVLGALVTTQISSRTLDAHPDWQYHYRLCGVISLVVAVVALIWLRELSPALRDQIMVSLRDRALVEARARGLDVQRLERNQWKQMMRFDILGSALAIALFLAFFYTIISFLPVYMATNFGFTPARANALGNWYWIASGVALVGTGIISDRMKVRKPFMLIGAVVSIIGLFMFIQLTDIAGTDYYTFALVMVVIAVGTGIAYSTWMAGFTETVEKVNPAATAVGLAVWGGILRTVVTFVLLGLLFVVTAAGTLVNHGPRLQEIQQRYSAEIATIQTVGADTMAELGRDPNDMDAQVRALTALTRADAEDIETALTLNAEFPQELATLQAVDTATLTAVFVDPDDTAARQSAVEQIAREFGIPTEQAAARLVAAQRVPPTDLAVASRVGPQLTEASAELQAVADIPEEDRDYLAEHGTEVQQARADSPEQWETWWWICLAAQVIFIPFVFFMSGHWSPRRAAEEAAEHDERVRRELETMEQR